MEAQDFMRNSVRRLAARAAGHAQEGVRFSNETVSAEHEGWMQNLPVDTRFQHLSRLPDNTRLYPADFGTADEFPTW